MDQYPSLDGLLLLSTDPYKSAHGMMLTQRSEHEEEEEEEEEEEYSYSFVYCMFRYMVVKSLLRLQRDFSTGSHAR